MAAATFLPSSKLKRVHVLVLVSSAHSAGLLQDMFAQLGFSNIHVAKDGYEGIQIMKRWPMHVVFADWDLKVFRKNMGTGRPSNDDFLQLSGAQFVHRLRYSPNSPNPFVPVVMLLDKATKGHVASARDAGINEVIMKPLSADDFCRRIISLIEDMRIFITSDAYRGPCRRRETQPSPAGEERRKREVRIVRQTARSA